MKRNGARSVTNNPRPQPTWRKYCLSGWDAWNRFWFTPSDCTTLAVIRILAGTMLLYTHAVWGQELAEFVGPQGRLSLEQYQLFYSSAAYPNGHPFAWSHLPWFEQTPGLWIVHGLALLVFALLTLGVATRVSSLLAFVLTVSYSHRLAAAQFGLDQINGALALYLAVGPSGAVLSVDAWWRSRKEGKGRGAGKSVPADGDSTCAGPLRVDATIATRLLQIHMCIMYLFAGLGKLLGETWWDGTALWGAFANLEYQTLNMTWLARHELLVNVMTHVVLAWEVGYCFLIWRPSLRPVMLALAVPLHLGIAFCMGMVTFGFAMLYGNLAFVPPQTMRGVLSQLRRFAGPRRTT